MWCVPRKVERGLSYLLSPCCIPQLEPSEHPGTAHSVPQLGTGSRHPGPGKRPDLGMQWQPEALGVAQVEWWWPLWVLTEVAPQKRPRILTAVQVLEFPQQPCRES